MQSKYVYAGLVALGVLIAACGDSGGDAASTPATTVTTAVTTEAVTTISEPLATSTSAPTDAATTQSPPTSAPVAVSALSVSGDLVAIAWGDLTSTAVYLPANESASDPFFQIHTNPATDGFFFSVELYTTGYGQQWTGELGTFEISCDDPAASTGICPYLDSDGAGPGAVLGDDFATTGSLTIVQLDNDGYEIIIHEVAFSDGTTIGEFTMSG